MEKRNASIAIVRLLAMIMIVFCHFMQYYELELAKWFNIGVQIFFVISGFLYGGKEIDKPILFLKTQFKKILIPYWIFVFIALIFYAIFSRDSISLTAIAKMIFCVGTVPGVGHLWFVGFILFCYFITPYLYYFKRETEKVSLAKFIVMCCALLAFTQIFGVLVGSYFGPDRINCYIVGYMLSIIKNRYSETSFKKIGVFFFITCFIMNIIRIYIKYISSVNLSGMWTSVFTLFEQYSRLKVAVTIVIAFYFCFSKFKYNNVLKISDKYSYPVYIVHQIFIIGPFSLMSFSPFSMLNSAVVLLCIALSAFFLYFVSDKVLRAFDKILKKKL